MVQSPCFLFPLADSLLSPFFVPFTSLEPSFSVTGSVHLGLRLLINWPPLPQPFPIPSPLQIPSTQVKYAPHYNDFKNPASLVRNCDSPTWSHTALLSRFHACCRSSFQLHNRHSRLLGGSPVESLQSHCIHTMSHWSSGLPVCFPSQGTQVENTRGELMWNRNFSR